MPLPPHAFTITGGCNCGALRYRIAVPPLEERPAHITQGPNPDLSDPKTARVPGVLACHCNDCRASTGNTAMQAVFAPAPSVTVSVIPRDPEEEKSRAILGRIVELPKSEEDVAAADAKRPPYVPAMDILRPAIAGSENTWLHFFHSFVCDPEIGSRAFCGRCGCPITCHFRPQQEWFGPMFRKPEYVDVMDVMLGTVDKHILDKEDWLAVENELFWDQGLGWQKAVSVKGRPDGAARHPDAVTADLVKPEDLL